MRHISTKVAYHAIEKEVLRGRGNGQQGSLGRTTAGGERKNTVKLDIQKVAMINEVEERKPSKYGGPPGPCGFETAMVT